MLSHSYIWRAIDMLASQHQLSPSGLARLAGLDATSFNPSKRFKADGRPRWPSTESIAKILNATDASLDQFFALQSETHPELRSKPGWAHDDILALQPAPDWPVYSEEMLLASGGSGGAPEIKTTSFKNGGAPNHPVPETDAELFGLRLDSDRFAPLYKQGAALVLSKGDPLEKNDRVILKSDHDGLVLGDIIHIRQRSISLQSLMDGGLTKTYALSGIEWVARILWASQ